jgi:hypothetical protein
MGVVERIGADRLDFGGGNVVQAPGPVCALEEHGDVVAVLIQWIDGAGDEPLRRVRGDNLYGFGPDGRLLWRVRSLEGVCRPLLLTGFLEDAPGLRLHEAHGWWVDVEPATGRVVAAHWIG